MARRRPDRPASTFFLVRHGAVDGLGKILRGRMPDVHLNDEGRRQASALARRFEKERLDRIFASPLERTQETARPIARRLRLEVETAAELVEVDPGEWTGLEFEDVVGRTEWVRHQGWRSGTRIPGGETLLEVQARVLGLVARLREERPGERIALVSHGDVIRVAVAAFLGMPIDLLERFDIQPASVTAVAVTDPGPRVLYLNSR